MNTKIYSLIILLFSYFSGSAQESYYNEQTYDLEADCPILVIPDSSIWIVGQTQKTLFNSALSGSNALITDTTHLYPQLHHSYFDFVFVPDNSFELSFKYKIDFDSFYAGGYIEASFDNGATWMDLNTIDRDISAFGMYSLLNFPNSDTLFNGKYGVTGTIDQWTKFTLLLAFALPVSSTIDRPDTAIFRFHVVSDTNAVPKEGWIIDDISFANVDWGSSISNKHNILYNVYPNPSKDLLNISINSNGVTSNTMTITDVIGRVVKTALLRNKEIAIPIHDLSEGLYMIRLSDAEGNTGVQKFIKE